MLLANRRVAERIGRKRGAVEPKTFVYRIHDQPSPEKLNQFIQFVAKLGYKMRISTERNLAKSFNELFEKLKGRERKTLWKHLLYAPWLKPNIQLKISVITDWLLRITPILLHLSVVIPT